MKANKQFQGRIPPTSLRHLFEDRVTHCTGACLPPLTPSRLKKHLNRLILPHLQLLMEGNLRSAGTRSLREECMFLQHKLADSNSEIQAPSSVLSGAQHLVTDLDPYSCYHKKNFIKANVYLNNNPSVFPFPPPFIRSD